MNPFRLLEILFEANKWLPATFNSFLLTITVSEPSDCF